MLVPRSLANHVFNISFPLQPTRFYQTWQEQCYKCDASI